MTVTTAVETAAMTAMEAAVMTVMEAPAKAAKTAADHNARAAIAILSGAVITGGVTAAVRIVPAAIGIAAVAVSGRAIIAGAITTNADADRDARISGGGGGQGGAGDDQRTESDFRESFYLGLLTHCLNSEKDFRPRRLNRT